MLDRRVTKRHAVNLPIQISYSTAFGSAKTKLSVSSATISEAGISVVSDNVPISVNNIDLAISLPKPYPPIDVKGKIVWRRSLLKKNRYLYGVALQQEQDEMLDILKMYLKFIPLQQFNDSSERRRNQRRQSNQSQSENKRADDRRGHNRFFEKAVRFGKRMEHVKAEGLYFYLRTLESPSQSHILIDGKEMLMFGSNNYLGLTTHPKVKEAAIKATEKYGAGAGAVRLLGGTLKLHNQLEEKIAEFKKTEAAIVYSAGYTANIATVSTLLATDNDIAVIDEKDHASIIDGVRLASASMRVFSHNDMIDLEQKLSTISEYTNKFIIVDGVYSMDGDIANLMAIYRLAKQYRATVMIDEAHATGVIGKTGRGTPEHFGLEGRIDVVMGTLSKALGAIGGFVAGSKSLVDYLKHSARAFVFSSALPPAVCASTIAAMEVIETEPEWVHRLQENGKLLRDGLQQLGFNTGLSCTAIVPVLIGHDMKTYQMTKALQDLGIYVSPVVRPAVKRGSSRLRVSAMATHTHEDIKKALDAFEKTGKSLGIIK